MTGLVTVVVHLGDDDDPFDATEGSDWSHLAIIRTGGTHIIVKTAAQADSLIRAAVTAKDLLLSAAIPAATS